LLQALFELCQESFRGAVGARDTDNAFGVKAKSWGSRLQPAQELRGLNACAWVKGQQDFCPTLFETFYSELASQQLDLHDGKEPLGNIG
jgi:hypothetical protein